MVPPVLDLLVRADAPHEYVNIHNDYQARQHVQAINYGNESVPTLVFPDGSTLTEPRTGPLKDKLADLGYRPAEPEWVESVKEAITCVVG